MLDATANAQRCQSTREKLLQWTTITNMSNSPTQPTVTYHHCKMYPIAAFCDTPTVNHMQVT